MYVLQNCCTFAPSYYRGMTETERNLLYGVVSLILPENILDQFDIVKLEEEDIARNDGSYQPFKRNVHIYLDSLAVLPEYRRLGIAKKLVMIAKKRADRMRLRLGLLVDKDNPEGEAFYTHVGFQYEGDSQWGGHEMKHLVL